MKWNNVISEINVPKNFGYFLLY